MLKYISAEKISLRIDLLRTLADTDGQEFIYEQVSSTDRNRDKRNIKDGASTCSEPKQLQKRQRLTKDRQ